MPPLALKNFSYAARPLASSWPRLAAGPLSERTTGIVYGAGCAAAGSAHATASAANVAASRRMSPNSMSAPSGGTRRKPSGAASEPADEVAHVALRIVEQAWVFGDRIARRLAEE